MLEKTKDDLSPDAAAAGLKIEPPVPAPVT